MTSFPNTSFPCTFIVVAKPLHPNPPAFGGLLYDLVLYFSCLWQAIVCETSNLNIKLYTHQFSCGPFPSMTLALETYLVSNLVSSVPRRITCFSSWTLFGGPVLSSQPLSKPNVADPLCCSFFAQILPAGRNY